MTTVRHEILTQRLLSIQSSLYAYIVTLVSDLHVAQDILQNANIVMLRKLDEVPSVEQLQPWAFKVAHYEVLGHRRDSARDRVVFDDELIGRIAQVASQAAGSYDARRDMLLHCLQRLPADKRAIIERRYRANSVGELAGELGRPIGSVRQALYRARTLLLDCMRRKMREEGLA